MAARAADAGRALAGVALAAAAVALTLLAAEGVARWLWRPPEPPPPEHPAVTDPALAGLPEIWTPFELVQPNVRAVHFGVLHRTNRYGLRGPEIDPTPAPGALRIVLAGDSLVMGHRVQEDERYSAVLEGLLRAGGCPQCEVVNVGVSGLNAQHVVSRIERVGLFFQPDLIVYGFTVNDIEGPGYRGNPRELRDAHLAERARFHDSPSRLLRIAWPHFVSAWSSFFPMRGSYEAVLIDNYFHNPEAWARVVAALDLLAGVAREADVCGVVFVHAVFHQLSVLHPFTSIYERVGEAASKRGLFVVQSLPALRHRSAAALRFDPIDTHPNPAGHRLLARALYDGLRELPPRCGLPQSR